MNFNLTLAHTNTAFIEFLWISFSFSLYKRGQERLTTSKISQSSKNTRLFKIKYFLIEIKKKTWILLLPFGKDWTSDYFCFLWHICIHKTTYTSHKVIQNHLGLKYSTSFCITWYHNYFWESTAIVIFQSKITFQSVHLSMESPCRKYLVGNHQMTLGLQILLNELLWDAPVNFGVPMCLLRVFIKFYVRWMCAFLRCFIA